MLHIVLVFLQQGLEAVMAETRSESAPYLLLLTFRGPDSTTGPVLVSGGSAGSRPPSYPTFSPNHLAISDKVSSVGMVCPVSSQITSTGSRASACIGSTETAFM